MTFIDSPAAILIIGGQNAKTEVIDLATGGAESCVSDVLAPHFSENAMGIFVGDKPTICGGGSYYSYIYSDKCLSYDMVEGKWIPYTRLPETRLNAHHQSIENESKF